MNFVLLGISAIVLFIGWKWGAIAIMGGSVTRQEQPQLYWGAMALTAFLALVAIALIATGN